MVIPCDEVLLCEGWMVCPETWQVALGFRLAHLTVLEMNNEGW